MKSRIVAIGVQIAVIWSLGTTACVAQESTSPDRVIKDKWALIVGISNFQDNSINLKFAAKDAQDFYQYLIKEAHFAPDHVRLLTNEQATRENILSQLGDEWLPRVVQPDDLALIFISSHGSPATMDLEGINYVVAHNTDKNRLYATGIPIQELSRIIKERVHSDRVVVILDACHSGSAKTAEKGIKSITNFNAEAIAQGTGQMVICSSAPDETSWESRNYDNGVFTHHLIEALRSKPKMVEVFDYLKEQVRTEVLQDRGALQTPQLKSKWTGEQLAIGVPPAKPRAGLPNYLTPPPLVAVKPTTAITATSPPQMVPIGLANVPPMTTPPAVAAPIASPASVPRVAVATTTPASAKTVQSAANFGEQASNGHVRMRVLDAEQKMTGFYVTVELENCSPGPIEPYFVSFETSKDGYYQEKLGGVSISGADVKLSPGQKCKLSFGCAQTPDELLVKFSGKPGWGPLELRLTGDAPGTSPGATAAATTTVSVPSSTNGNFENYASNGFVRMKMLDAEQKMTGFYMTVEVVNDSGQPVEPWGFVFSQFKGGYSIGSSTGSSLYGADTIPPGRKAKLEFSSVEQADEIQVKFPKPNWKGLTLRLQ